MVPSSNYNFKRLPEELFKTYDEFNEELNSLDDPYLQKKKRQSCLGKLKTIISMSCFGYNSSECGTKLNSHLVPN